MRVLEAPQASKRKLFGGETAFGVVDRR